MRPGSMIRPLKRDHDENRDKRDASFDRQTKRMLHDSPSDSSMTPTIGGRFPYFRY